MASVLSAEWRTRPGVRCPLWLAHLDVVVLTAEFEAEMSGLAGGEKLLLALGDLIEGVEVWLGQMLHGMNIQGACMFVLGGRGMAIGLAEPPPRASHHQCPMNLCRLHVLRLRLRAAAIATPRNQIPRRFHMPRGQPPPKIARRQFLRLNHPVREEPVHRRRHLSRTEPQRLGDSIQPAGRRCTHPWRRSCIRVALLPGSAPATLRRLIGAWHGPVLRHLTAARSRRLSDYRLFRRPHLPVPNLPVPSTHPRFRFQISDFSFQISAFRFQLSAFPPAPYTLHPMQGHPGGLGPSPTRRFAPERGGSSLAPDPRRRRVRRGGHAHPEFQSGSQQPASGEPGCSRCSPRPTPVSS